MFYYAHFFLLLLKHGVQGTIYIEISHSLRVNVAPNGTAIIISSKVGVNAVTETVN